MNSKLILTVIGPDQPGIVDQLSQVVIDHNGNWLESRMCNLAGQFAGILLVECKLQNCAPLREAIEAISIEGLEIDITMGADDSSQASRENIQLEISGPDHPGIVHDISHFLATHDINIVEISSGCEEAAMSGGYIFNANLIASIPKAQSIQEIESALDDLADKLNVDITFDNLKGTRTHI